MELPVKPPAITPETNFNAVEFRQEVTKFFVDFLLANSHASLNFAIYFIRELQRTFTPDQQKFLLECIVQMDRPDLLEALAEARDVVTYRKTGGGQADIEALVRSIQKEHFAGYHESFRAMSMAIASGRDSKAARITIDSLTEILNEGDMEHAMKVVAMTAPFNAPKIRPLGRPKTKFPGSGHY